MVRVADFAPAVVGSKRTLNVLEEPLETELKGCENIENSAASGPDKETELTPRFSLSSPVFSIVNVRSISPSLISIEPKSVWSAACGVVSPSAMFCPLPVTFISGVPDPVPEIAKVYGSSLLSLFAIESVALRVPSAEGSKSTVTLVDTEAATVVAGCDVTVKSAALVPESEAAFAPSVSVLVPVFSIVNVRLIVPDACETVPKNV